MKTDIAAWFFLCCFATISADSINIAEGDTESSEAGGKKSSPQGDKVSPPLLRLALLSREADASSEESFSAPPPPEPVEVPSAIVVGGTVQTSDKFLVGPVGFLVSTVCAAFMGSLLTVMALKSCQCSA